MRKMSLFGICMAIGAVAAYLRTTRRHMSFKDKVVLITGASRGLGLVMARRLVSQRAKVVIVARDVDELRLAKNDLIARGGTVHTEVCDVTNETEVRRLVARVNERFGRLDVIINNAGTIQVGPIEVQTKADYEEAMQTHYWGPLNLILAALPMLRKQKAARIVNIVSIGGLISIPHMLPYSSSKFALLGLSEGLHAELAKDNITVTTVCPGMMRTGSHVNAKFKGRNKLEYAWFSIGNSLPFISMAAEEAAKEILSACQRGEPHVTLTVPAQIAAKFHGFCPGWTAELMALVNAMLPSPGGIGAKTTTGKESHSKWSPSSVTVMSDTAAAANNQ